MVFDAPGSFLPDNHPQPTNIKLIVFVFGKSVNCLLFINSSNEIFSAIDKIDYSLSVYTCDAVLIDGLVTLLLSSYIFVN